MVGRSLLSFLATAAVAIGSCAAQLQPGKYQIIIGGNYGPSLISHGNTAGGKLTVLPGPGAQVWDVKPATVPFIPEYSISYSGKDLYAAPLEKTQFSPVALSDTKFIWRIIGDNEQGYTVVRADDKADGLALSVGQSPAFLPVVDTENLRDGGDTSQRWYFRRVGDFSEPQSHCGPKRIQRGSFYHQ
jgi:hypothetical protein